MESIYSTQYNVNIVIQYNIIIHMHEQHQKMNYISAQYTAVVLEKILPVCNFSVCLLLI